ncbi:MAG TPA: hypothetical protein VG518_01730 [Solirubrobacterales bacterium]|nr:hypothetical protein [Solirubrobacterales bacterium]
MQESIEILRAAGCSLEIVAMHLRDLGFQIEGATLGAYFRTVRAGAAEAVSQRVRRRSSSRAAFRPLSTDPRRPTPVGDLEDELAARLMDPACAHDGRSCAEVEAELDRLFGDIEVTEAPDPSLLGDPPVTSVEQGGPAGCRQRSRLRKSGFARRHAPGPYPPNPEPRSTS